MALLDHPKVRRAYEARTYLDRDGNKWRRGMDGWFLDDADGMGGVLLCRHEDFVNMVEAEHPEPPA